MPFLADLAKSGMQTQSAMDAKMRERVAETSINAQKIVDGMTQPEFTFTYFLREPRTFDRPLYGVAHPDLKYSDQGTRSTFLAAKEYNEEDKKRRDELLAKYKKEESAES